MATSAARGGYPSWAAQALTEVCRRLADVVPAPEYAVRGSAFSSPAHADVPVFRGFKDDAVRWVQLIDSLAACHAWPENIKRSVAEERLRDAARAWNLYDGHTHFTWANWSGALIAAFGNFSDTYNARYMEMRSRYQGHGENIKAYIYDKLRLLVDCGLPWLSPAARQYVIDGLADPAQAAILALQPRDLSLQDFIDLAVELQLHQGATRETDGPRLQASMQTPAENPGPGPELSDSAVKEEEATSETQAFLVGEPPSTWAGSEQLSYPEGRRPPSFYGCVGDEVLSEHHQGTAHQLDDVNLRSTVHRSSLSQLPFSGLAGQQPHVVALTPTPPSKRSENGSYVFSDITTTAPLNQDNVSLGSLTEPFNNPKVLV